MVTAARVCRQQWGKCEGPGGGGSEKVCGGGQQGGGGVGGQEVVKPGVCCGGWCGAVGGLCPEVVARRSSRGAAGGAGVEPVKEQVKLVCTLFVPLSCSFTSPLEAGDLSHPPPYIPGVIALQFGFQFPPVVFLTLPDAEF